MSRADLPEDLERQRWLTFGLGVLLLGSSVAVCVTHWVTMATLHIDSDRLEFGFPLPAFRAGSSSGTWTVDAVPLTIDLFLALVVAVPVIAVVCRRVPRRRVLALGVAAGMLVGALHAEPLLTLAAGFHKVHWELPEHQSVRCRALWIGAPVRWLRDADPDRPCVSLRHEAGP